MFYTGTPRVFPENPTMNVDLFSGAGGWHEGLKQLGSSATGVELEMVACQTAKAAGHEVMPFDVRDVDPEHLSEPVTGLIASPPCQTFSVSGKGSGRKALDDVLAGLELVKEGHEVRGHFEDDRTELVLEPMRWVINCEPEWCAFEQVPPVLPVWNAYAEHLRKLGYKTWAGTVNAEQYGVPQTRSRAILLAHKSKPVGMPLPTHSKYYNKDPSRLDPGLPQWVSMAEALGWGLTERPAPSVAATSASGGGPRPLDGGAGTRDMLRRAREEGKWVPHWTFQRPATTLVASYSPEIVRGPGYRHAGDGPSQNALGGVQVTVEEAGVLQTFPRDYPWMGTRSEQFRLVGNAIPPTLAMNVLKGFFS